MGDALERQVQVAGGPGRCPFCHDAVERSKERWVACEACLARHHADCWHEAGACAGCGETAFVSSGQQVTVAAQAPGDTPTEEVPALEVELRGRRAHFEASPGPLRFVARAGHARERIEVRVANRTERAQTVEVRMLPPHLELRGPERQTLQPGEVARFALDYVCDAAPEISERAQRRRPVHFVRVTSAAFVLSCEEGAYTAQVEAWHAFGPLALALLTLALTLVVHIGLVLWVTLTFRPTVAPSSGGSAALFEARQRDEVARVRAALGLGLRIVVGLLAFAGLVALLTA